MIIRLLLLLISFSLYAGTSHDNIPLSLQKKSLCLAPNASCALTLYQNGSSVNVTVVNQSTASTAKNVTAHFENTALFGAVTSTTCASIPPLGSCTLTFTPGSVTVPLTSFVISGSNTLSLDLSMQIYGFYTVGGTLSGLSGSVTLQNNGGDDLILNSNGGFTFSTSIAQGNTYNVTVSSQPFSQTCIVTNGSGTMGAGNVTNVLVNCTNNATTISLGSPTAVIEVEASPTTSVTVTNTGAAIAYNVHAVLPGAWTSVTQDATNCTTIAPAASCNLLFSTTEPYIAQGNISVTGDNILTPPSLAISYSINGYLVFDKPSAISATVLDAVDVSGSADWYTSIPIAAIATSLSDGAANTSDMQMTSDANYIAALLCYNSTNGGAAVGDWYLPAICQMAHYNSGPCVSTLIPNINDNLVQLGFTASLSGTYWSSTGLGGVPQFNAWSQDFTGAGSQAANFLDTPFAVRCVRETNW